MDDFDCGLAPPSAGQRFGLQCGVFTKVEGRAQGQIRLDPYRRVIVNGSSTGAPIIFPMAASGHGIVARGPAMPIRDRRRRALGGVQ